MFSAPLRVACGAPRCSLGGLLALLALSGLAVAAEQQAEAFLRVVVGSDVEAVDPADSLLSTDGAERRVCLNAGVFVLAAVMAPIAAFDSDESELVFGAAYVRPAGAGPLDPTVTQMVLRPDSPHGWTSFGVDEPACFNIVVVNGRARIYQLGVFVFE